VEQPLVMQAPANHFPGIIQVTYLHYIVHQSFFVEENNVFDMWHIVKFKKWQHQDIYFIDKDTYFFIFLFLSVNTV
jgi:hypothetical protein